MAFKGGAGRVCDYQTRWEERVECDEGVTSDVTGRWSPVLCKGGRLSARRLLLALFLLSPSSALSTPSPTTPSLSFHRPLRQLAWRLPSILIHELQAGSESGSSRSKASSILAPFFLPGSILSSTSFPIALRSERRFQSTPVSRPSLRPAYPHPCLHP